VKILGWFCALVATACSTATAATLHVDTFDSATQGWVGGGGPVHVAIGGAGDGAGYLSVPSASHLATYNADASWIGNYTSIGAGRVVVDLRVPEGMPELEMRVVLFGPDNTQQQRFTSTVAQTVPADNVWREYTFSLASADLVPTQVLDPPLAYSQTMGNVLQLMLRHDPGQPSHKVDGSDEDISGNVSGVLHVDNIELAPAPIAGDFDSNGLVNAADLTHPTLGWKQRYGNDLDGDDFLVWQRGLNVPSAAAVPEPATLAAIPFVICALVRRRPTIRPLS
jgi:hypothetical protein